MSVVASLLLSAAAALSFQEIRVQRGHPVAEAPDGVVFSQMLDEQCRPLNIGTDAPLAGSVGASIRLQFSLASCSSADPNIETTCSYEITSRTGQKTSAEEFSIAGLRGEIDVHLPETTGVYDLALSCSGASERRTLYVTYGAPLISPPKAEWYDRACSWGAGFSSASAEEEVLRGMLSQLYSYGSASWRYGSFPDDVPPGSANGPSCSGTGDHRWCSCSWQDLVTSGSRCRFGSCYEFSEVFEAMASVLGIGGFEPVEVRGGAEAGFATSAEVVSFDTRFPRNVECGAEGSEGGGCPRYVFSSHSLRRRDGTIFDATFDRTYESEAAPVYLSIRYVPGRTIGSELLVFEKSPASLILDQPGTAPDSYGSWDYYSYLPERPFQSIPMVELHPPGETPKPQFEKVDFEIVKDSSGRLFLAVRAVLEVTSFSDGTLHLRGELTKAGELVSNKPRRDDPRFTMSTIRGKGKHQVRLLFAGEDLFQSGLDGPYQLEVHVHEKGTKGQLTSLVWETPPYDHTLFGGARIDALRIEGNPLQASFLIREPGLYRYIARLAREEKTLAYATGALELEPGPQSVPLSFPSAAVPGSTISFEVLNRDWESEAYVEVASPARTSRMEQKSSILPTIRFED